MRIKTFVVNPFQMNSYVYFCENSLEGVVIDPGYYTIYEQDELIDFLNKNSIKIKYIVNTHGHIDHVLGNAFAAEQFQVPVLIHKDDLFLYNKAPDQGLLYGIRINELPAPDISLDEKYNMKIGNNELKIIHTPGHSPGGICIADKMEKIVFCGDTIFKLSIGRTDLPGGDYDTIIRTIKTKLFNFMDDDVKLYPGHMESTTIGYEKENNPFLK